MSDNRSVSPSGDAKTKRAYALLAAAASQMNDELTIILTAADGIQPGDAEVKALLSDIKAATQRLVWEAASILVFAKKGLDEPVRASVGFLTEDRQ
jgi:hypothetical protein